MDIKLHWQLASNGAAKKDEKSLAFKYRLGAKPNSMSQSMELKGLPDKINKDWKTKLTQLISTRQFRKETKAVVYAGSRRFELSGRNPGHFANNLANLILMERNKGRNRLGVANAASVLSLAAIHKS